MLLTIDINEPGLKPETRADLLAYARRQLGNTGNSSDAEAIHCPAVAEDVASCRGFDMSGVADLTYRQVQKWMDGVSERTKDGLRVFAEHGPVVDVAHLYEAGITNLGHFQSRTTMRTRTITGDDDVYLLTWDEGDDAWERDQATGRYVTGCYAVTEMTYHSLRRYFDFE